MPVRGEVTCIVVFLCVCVCVWGGRPIQRQRKRHYEIMFIICFSRVWSAEGRNGEGNFGLWANCSQNEQNTTRSKTNLTLLKLTHSHKCLH